MVKHNIQPIFNKESKVLILGSFSSPISRETGIYYGNPQNRMWKVLSSVYNEGLPKTKEEKFMFLLQHKLAMWDVLESCEIVGASDSTIKKEKPNKLAIIIKNSKIKAIATTGKKANQLYHKYNNFDICILELPSTIPANAIYSLNDLIQKYSEIKKFTTS